jgi:hypothetical protein
MCCAHPGGMKLPSPIGRGQNYASLAKPEGWNSKVEGMRTIERLHPLTLPSPHGRGKEGAPSPRPQFLDSWHVLRTPRMDETSLSHGERTELRIFGDSQSAGILGEGARSIERLQPLTIPSPTRLAQPGKPGQDGIGKRRGAT